MQVSLTHHPPHPLGHTLSFCRPNYHTISTADSGIPTAAGQYFHASITLEDFPGNVQGLTSVALKEFHMVNSL